MTPQRHPIEPSRTTPPAVHSPGLRDAWPAVEPHGRSRQWERDHRDQKVTYRGVELKLAWKVKSIAGDLSVPSGEVASILIEHALQAYERGELELYPRPGPSRMRMTLDPDRAWPSTCPGKGKRTRAGWRVITTWRGFSPALKGELSALASDAGLNVPIGELITALLRHGLRAHESGLLKLDVPPTASR